jgi:bleomycin hydrolase
MSDEWFSEFVYEVVIDKKYIPVEMLDVLKQTPIVLPALPSIPLFSAGG